MYGSSAVVNNGRNSEEHETCVVDSTTVDCKSCCCSNGKLAKESNEKRSRIFTATWYRV